MMTPHSEGQMRDGVAAAIRALRAERGWTQRELCRRTEISPAYLSELEAAQKDASAEVLERLASAFRIGIDQFTWIIFLGILHGEIPGVQRRESALNLARQALELSPGDRRDLERFVEFLTWRKDEQRAAAQREPVPDMLDETETSESETTED